MIQARGFHHEDSDSDDDDDFSDDEEQQTPLDEVDPFIFFVETIQGKVILCGTSSISRCPFCLKMPDKVVITCCSYANIRSC
jgi:hypothetical protein